MSHWDTFLSLDNFRLAWNRVLRSSHSATKDRIGLRVYAANLDPNLEDLVDRLGQQVYEPSYSESLFIPKRSGPLRRLSLLTVEDRLVYQGLVNIIAEATRSRFEALTHNHVYAHLASSSDSPFMLRKWAGRHGQYRKFLDRFRDLWRSGKRWVLEADIASFYDSIDHDLLCQQLREKWGIQDLLVDRLAGCLKRWAVFDDGTSISRGLPQGYEASDYLATLFLCPADECMIREGQFSYIRYVDDIRVLTSCKVETLRSLISYDLALKKQGLILQPAKLGFREVTDIRTEINRLASTLSLVDQQRQAGKDTARLVEHIFFSAWHQLQHDKHAESNLVFALNRLPKTTLGRDTALEVLRGLPWRSDAAANYLAQFVDDTAVKNALLHEISTHTIYAWYVANCIRALGRVSPDHAYRQLLQQLVHDSRLHWCERLAAVEALQDDEDSCTFMALQFSSEANYLVRTAMLMAIGYSAATSDQVANIIRMGIADPSSQVRAAAVWLFLEKPECGVGVAEFGTALGVHRRMIPSYSTSPTMPACYLRDRMIAMFGVAFPQGLDLRQELPLDIYENATDHLRRALRYYYTDPLVFISDIDSFNHILAMAVSELIDGKKIPRDEYGNILAAVQKTHACLYFPFSQCHEARCNSRGAHPWAISLGTWSVTVSHKEKEKLAALLRPAYQHFVDQFARKAGIPTP